MTPAKLKTIELSKGPWDGVRLRVPIIFADIYLEKQNKEFNVLTGKDGKKRLETTWGEKERFRYAFTGMRGKIFLYTLRAKPKKKKRGG